MLHTTARRSAANRTGVVTAVPFPGEEKRYVWLFTSRRHSARANLEEPEPISTWALTRLMAFDADYRPQKIVQIGPPSDLFVFQASAPVAKTIRAARPEP